MSQDRVLYGLAALFNFAVALGLVIPESTVWELLGMAQPPLDIFMHLLALFIALFGGAYLAIARNSAGKRPLVQFAIAGKLSVFAVALLHYLAGSVPVQLPLLATGDFVFALLFVRSLRRIA